MNYQRKQGAKEKTESVINFRPVFLFACFFVLGFLFSFAVFYKGMPAWVCLFILPISFGLVLLTDKTRFLKKSVVLCVAFLIGFSYFTVRLEQEKTVPVESGTYLIEGSVFDKSVSDDSAVYYLKSVSFDGKETDFYLKLSTSDERFEVGDKLLFTGKLTVNELTEKNLLYGKEKYRHTVSVLSEIEKSADTVGFFPVLRQKLYRGLSKGLDEDNAGLYYAVLTGEEGAIGDGLLKNVRYGGIAHIFAVSGLHIGALFLALTFFLERPKKKLPKPVRFLIATALLLFYGGISSFTPSVVRASVCCLIAYFNKLVGTKSDSLEQVGASAILVLLWMPLSLFTAGFVLSFSAYFGICFFMNTPSEFLRKKIFKERELITVHDEFVNARRRKIANFFATTLSAQLFTAPLLLYFFSYVSVWGLFLNVVFVPVMAVLFAPMLLLATVTTVLPVLSSVLLFLPNLLLSAVFTVFYAVDFSNPILTGTVGVHTVFYYLCLVILCDRVHLKGKMRVGLCIACFSLFTLFLLAGF